MKSLCLLLLWIAMCYAMAPRAVNVKLENNESEEDLHYVAFQEKFLTVAVSLITGENIDLTWITQLKNDPDRQIYFGHLPRFFLEALLLKHIPKNPPYKDPSYFKGQVVPTFKYYYSTDEKTNRLKVVFGRQLLVFQKLTLFDLAIFCDRVEVVEAIMQHLPEWALRSSETGMNIFHTAAYNGNVQILEILYSMLPKPYYWILKTKSYNMNFCQIAIFLNFAHVLGFCLEKDLISKDEFDISSAGDIFHFAAFYLAYDCFSLLLKHFNMKVSDIKSDIHGGTIFHSFASGKKQNGKFELSECHIDNPCDCPHFFNIDDAILFADADATKKNHAGTTYLDLLNGKNMDENNFKILLDSFQKDGVIPKKFFGQHYIGYLFASRQSIFESLITDPKHWGLFTNIIGINKEFLYFRSLYSQESLLQIAAKSLSEKTAHHFVKILGLYKAHNIPIDWSFNVQRKNLFRDLINSDNIFGLALLKKHGISLNMRDDMGFTPLEYAIRKQKIDVVKYLISVIDRNSLFSVTWEASSYRELIQVSIAGQESRSQLLAQLLSIAPSCLTIPTIFKDQVALNRVIDSKSSLLNAEIFFLSNLGNNQIEKFFSLIRLGKPIFVRLSNPTGFKFEKAIYRADKNLEVSRHSLKIDNETEVIVSDIELPDESIIEEEPVPEPVIVVKKKSKSKDNSDAKANKKKGKVQTGASSKEAKGKNHVVEQPKSETAKVISNAAISFTPESQPGANKNSRIEQPKSEIAKDISNAENLFLPESPETITTVDDKSIKKTKKVRFDESTLLPDKKEADLFGNMDLYPKYLRNEFYDSDDELFKRDRSSARASQSYHKTPVDFDSMKPEEIQHKMLEIRNQIRRIGIWSEDQ